MAKLTRVTFELPPTSHRVLEQAAQENGINVQAAASLILQAALARRISGLVPKRPGKSGAGGRQASGPPATESGSPVSAADAVPSLGLPEGSGTE